MAGLLKKVTCSTCGKVWTTNTPALLIECSRCGDAGVLSFDLTQHRRDKHSTGIIIWSGPLDAGLRFYLVAMPNGQITCGVR